MMKLKRAILSDEEQARFEEEAGRICRDFNVYYDYMTENPVKIYANTGNLGKKDCFLLNQLFSWKEDYEKGTYFQKNYAVIDFFQYFAFRFHLLENSHEKAGRIVKGRNYERFAGLSQSVRYLMFFAVLLSEYSLNENGYGMQQSYYEIESLLNFCADSTPNTYVPLNQEKSFLEYHLYVYSTQLRIFQIMNICDTKFIPKVFAPRLVPLIESVRVLEMGTYAGRIFKSIHEKDKNKTGGRDIFKWLDVSYSENLLNDFIKSYHDFFPREEIQPMMSFFETEPPQSCQNVYTLDISLRGKRCRRTIKIDSRSTLAGLHNYIQRIFEFDNDHLYSFTIGTGRLKREYFSQQANELNDAGDITLGELGLSEGQAFTYLFDFGACWNFDIKVKECLEGTIKCPETVSAVGKPPLQYPSWDEEEWEEDEE